MVNISSLFLWFSMDLNDIKSPLVWVALRVIENDKMQNMVCCDVTKFWAVIYNCNKGVVKSYWISIIPAPHNKQRNKVEV